MQTGTVIVFAALLGVTFCAGGRDVPLVRVQPARNFVSDISASAKPATDGDNWAVLVAGSNGWYNYRHQADICHAYHILLEHGVSADKIIVFMYDDIAHNQQNPEKGVIRNHPNGPNVYTGVKIDYRGEEVTPDMFAKVLTGNAALKAQGKRVLESGPNDRVFVNFADHGAPGIIGFPSDTMTATQLSRAMQTMFQKKMYKQMVFYLEACESGSMFEGSLMPPTWNIYGMTAANAEESSYATYFDNKIQNYLGDLFSVNWMEDSDASDISTETLELQFRKVKERTNLSHVMQYGDLTFLSEPVGTYLGMSGQPGQANKQASPHRDAVRQQDATMNILVKKYAAAHTDQARNAAMSELMSYIKFTQDVSNTFERIISVMGPHRLFRQKVNRRDTNIKIDFDCYNDVVALFHERCYRLGANTEAMQHLYKFVNLCNLTRSAEPIKNAIRVAC